VLELSAFLSVSAQEQVASDSISLQLTFLKATLKKDETRSKVWWWGWFSGYSAATAAQVAVAYTSEKQQLKQDMYLGATTTLIGAAGQFLSPLTPYNVSAHLDKIPENNDFEREQKLLIAEEMLRRCTQNELDGRSWKMHAMSGAVNLSSGIITWVGFRRTWKDGLLNFVLNTAITEAQIWTQPMLARNAYLKYNRRYHPADESLVQQTERPTITFLASANYIGLILTF